MSTPRTVGPISVHCLGALYAGTGQRLLFRGQSRDHGAILAGVYRDLWPHRDELPGAEAVANSIDAEASLTVSSPEVARALVQWKVRVDRYFRFGFPLTRLLETFYPAALARLQTKEWGGTLGHLMAVHQHAGCKTTQLDWTWNPLVAAWFACHELVGATWRLRSGVSEPVVYVLNPARVAGRVRDLCSLPEFLLRPQRQQGATIGTQWIEDLRSCVDEIVKVAVPSDEAPFEEAGLTAAYLFPDAEDSVNDLYLYWTEKGHDLPWLIDWALDNPDSALGRLYRACRSTVITQLSLTYDAFWVRGKDGHPIVIDYRGFDEMKLDGKQPERCEWSLRAADPSFCENGWGPPNRQPLAIEKEECRIRTQQLVESDDAHTIIHWGRERA